VVAEVADRVAVMYAGRMAELGSVHDVFANPMHPYTQGLLRSVPNIELTGDELYRMEGQPPNLVSPPSGCRFHDRCPHVMDICKEVVPGFDPVRWDRRVACWLYQQQPAHSEVTAAT